LHILATGFHFTNSATTCCQLIVEQYPSVQGLKERPLHVVPESEEECTNSKHPLEEDLKVVYLTNLETAALRVQASYCHCYEDNYMRVGSPQNLQKAKGTASADAECDLLFAVAIL
jgi:hypothetical protein